MASSRSFEEAMASEDVDLELGTGSARKRRRLSSSRSSLRSTTQQADEASGEESESSQPVLPDAYRRSPSSTRGTHQPGSIVRVTLRNFVTYTDAEFHPGPNLNMVIGPNGTGKSTLVCAICLGLGWGTANLGRAKDISEFVKHGSQRATIEIELARNPELHESNPIITTRITKENSKVEFAINGRKSTKKDLQKLTNSFSIQVDNLCQFLPQDRVVEFASLTPVQLLTQTQRAAAPAYMSQWHDELKALGKESKAKQTEQQGLLESLKRMQDRQRAQQPDVDRIREHSTLQERIAALQKFRPFPLYQEQKAKFLEAKTRKKASEKQLNRLQRQLEPNLRATNNKAQYLEEIRNSLSSKQRITKRVGDETSKINRQYEDRNRDLKTHKDQHEKEKRTMKETQASIAKIMHNIQKIQNDMKNVPPTTDFAAMNQEIREQTRQIRSLNEEEEQSIDRIRDWKGQTQQRLHLIRDQEAKKEHMQSQLGKQASRLFQVSPDAARAWQWIQENKQNFDGEVYGPPMITCTVKDRQNTAAVEQGIGRKSALCFTVTNDADFRRLSEQFNAVMHLKDVTFRIIEKELAWFAPPCTTEQLMHYGLECWLIDLIEGPAPVLAMLCDTNSIDSVGYTKRDLDARQTERLKSSPITQFVTAKEFWNIARRREYGDNAVSMSVTALRPASLFTDAPVDREQERHLDRAILEARDEIETLKNSVAREQTTLEGLQQRRQTLADEKKSKEDAKNALQSARTAFDALPTRLEGQQANLADAKRKIKDFEKVCNSYDDRLDQLHLEKGQLALNFANSVEQFRVLHMELLAIELMEIEAISDHDQLRRRHAEEEALLAQHRKEVAELTIASEALKAEALASQESCRVIGTDLSDFESNIYHEIGTWSSDQLELEIQSAEARLEMNTGGSRHVIKEFEQREKQISNQQTHLEEIKTSLETLTTNIQDIQERWEPLLNTIINQISASFAENFASINCAGEVSLYKDEDFEQWAIQIKVKFREQEPLSLLDSHRQSGGERAVSTIFYLMALQSLARAPFRVVDEINQGMDPRNERLVHSRLVSIACQSARDDGSGGSQYFLITPKLLTGLEYHPNMKVHCIASGEWMPSDHTSLDFQKLAVRALAVRAAEA